MVKRRLQLRRQRGFDVDALPGERMREGEAGRVQELALEAELTGPAVDGVSGDGESDGGEMDADLMRPARLELHVEERVAREELNELEVRDRLARRVGVE